MLEHCEKVESETFSFNCNIESTNRSNLQKLDDDLIEIINEYVKNNSLFDSCKELHQLKKKFLQIELTNKKSVKFLKKDKYRNYIYSLIDNPRKQLVLNIVDDIKERSFDFIFDESENFGTQYLDIINNVYQYKLSYLSLNRDISPNSIVPSVKFNKKYLNFISLDVKLLIHKLVVDSVTYDIEHILKNKNIKINKILQTPDILCVRDCLQYDLYQKLKVYSKKYSIYFQSIRNPDLIRIIKRYNPTEILNNNPRLPEPFAIRKKEEYCLQSLLDNINNINIRQDDELPTLTESYIKQMNDEYYKNKR
tara:strand:- start:153 stop:1076 length:924 start_codon:yes stop_codon:yes gene_type:complete